jgi:pyruvate,orthophosphate dikinase
MAARAQTPADEASRPALDHLLDEHAELRDVVAQLRAAGDDDLRRGLLHRLDALLRGHFAREEADPELRRMLAGPADGMTDRGDWLADEHRELLAALALLIERVEEIGDGAAEGFAGEVAAFLDRLHDHDACESERIGWGLDTDLATLPSPDEISDALSVNLRRTAVDVVIPAEQAVLLEITADQYGVHESTRKLLREINHRYVGWPETLEDLHRRAMGDFARYVAHERCAEAIGVFCSLYARAAEQASPDPVREAAVRQWLYYLEKIVTDAGEALPVLLPVIERAVSRLGAIFEREPGLSVLASPRLRQFTEKLMAANCGDAAQGVAERTLDLLASALARVYARWLAEPDPVAWWRESAIEDPAAVLPEPLAAISHARLAESQTQLHRASGAQTLAARAARLLALPDNGRIERGYLDAAACLESGARPPRQSQIARIQWLIQVLSSEALVGVHQRALSEIHHASHDALTGADGEGVEQLVRETFAGLRRSGLQCSPAALALITRIGELVLASGDPKRAGVVIEELLDWDFPGPGFSGFTDEWRVRVDPAHLGAIRAFLAVIEANPELARPLIAALVVHLKSGGIFVADTDLFQKDVSKLLNSEIAPVYHLAKQLLRIFPVYFSEIGAEGELRKVSSRIDEIGARKDHLCHFLRKQCHVESNPRLIDFVDAIGDFWSSGDRDPLRPYLPDTLYASLAAESEEDRAMRRAFSQLAGSQGLAGLAALDAASFERRLAGIPDVRAVDAEKARLLVRLRQLLARKYELGHDDLVDRIAALRLVDTAEVEALRDALADQHDEDALEVLIAALERLKQTISSGERTEGLEDIYRKRHIAVGIPSIYGSYREEKFEAMGLSFRIESLASVLFERMISAEGLGYVTRDGLRRTRGWLLLLMRAVRVEGCRGRGLAAGIAMLDQALATQGVSADQYLNIFQILSRGVEQLIRIRFIDVYQDVLDRILRRRLGGEAEAEAAAGGEAVLKASEGFLRDRIAESFGLQALDRLVGKVLRSLAQARGAFDRDALGLIVSFDADRCCVPIDATETPLDGAVLLGNKGYQIKRLARDGLPVPPGFILTTELFRCWPAVRACDELRGGLSARIRAEIGRLEERTGSRFGDPRRPLLLAVRSGAAVSMPGVLDTFLNVGITEKIAEGLAGRSRSAWGAWDAYRRFLQSWGMGHHIARDRFDELMRGAKEELGVAKKAEIPAEAMRELAMRYRRFVEDHGVEIASDPADQVDRCVELVLQSWDAEKARVYRGELSIAEEWGTAVLVQSMVYGNLDALSGTGVVLTCDPRRPSGDVRLHGDFVVQGQGDDVVSGLVDTLPISEEQRRAGRSGETRSLEKDFPGIYRALLAHARALIRDRGMFHQELEFTFESDDPADLYVLQTRDSVMAAISSVSAFVPSADLERSRLAAGIGAGGGALSGRLAHTAEDVESLRRRYPDDPIILARPDTVPDDIPLILQTDGMLTSLGGATSHAALVAQQLGRTCVVGCRQLHVDEQQRRSRIGGCMLSTGEFVSINGIDGSVYSGQHRSTTVRRRRLV